jgi:hypothetical protein
MPRTLRLSLPIAAVALLAAGGSSLAAGGLSVSPPIVEKVAAPGPVGSVKVNNTTSGPLKIAVAVRPWVQARSGAVRPDRKKSLSSRVRVSAAAFTLAPGTSKVVDLKLLGTPGSGSLYGSIEVVGTPPKASSKSSGITAAYRIVGSLRLNPTAARRVLRLQVGTVRTAGSGARRVIAGAVRNAGNTVDEVSGTARITGPGGSRSIAIAKTRILPGAIVDLGLGSVRGLRAGSYTARVSLFQTGRPVVTTSRKFVIR